MNTLIGDRRRRNKGDNNKNIVHNQFNYDVPLNDSVIINDFALLKEKMLKMLPAKGDRKKLKRSLTKVNHAGTKSSLMNVVKMIDSICHAIDSSVATLVDNSNKYKAQYDELLRTNNEFAILSEIPPIIEKIKEVEEKQENDHSKKNILRDLSEFEERMDKMDSKVSKLNSQLKLFLENQPSATANFQSQLLRIETQSRHAIDEVQMLNNKVDSRGKRQLEELEKLCTTQVSLYLSGISNDIVNLSNKVDTLLQITEKQEKRMDLINDTSNRNLNGLANDICKVVVDLQHNRDATLNIQQKLEHARNQERKKRLIAKSSGHPPSRTSNDNRQEQNKKKNLSNHPEYGFMNYILFDNGTDKIQQTKKANDGNTATVDITEYKLLKKTVKELQLENKMLKTNVHKSLEKMETFSEMVIKVYQNSEKRNRAQIHQLREALLSFSRQLCMVTECYNGIK
jgi:hypothetical protein